MGTVQLRDVRKTLPLRVLSPRDWEQWTTQGYVVVRQAVPGRDAERLAAALRDFLDMRPDDPATWSSPHTGNERLPGHSGLVELYNHQAQWDIRQTQRVYDAFVDVWDRTDLWVTIDYANVNPPNRGSRAFEGFVHWDVDTSADPPPVRCQGVLSLSDGDEEIGGFQCVPEIFADWERWVRTQPGDRDPFTPDLTGYGVTTPRVRPGDLVIFNSLLPHGVHPNVSRDRVRMAQYLTMAPAWEENTGLRQARVRFWEDRVPPHPPEGGVRKEERSLYGRAALTPLGERLLGLRSWRD
ncbi:phytanoyl-CoA dioxygenase family protein [Streptomyces sp. TRM 70351]|uniref:phytanoyl-CoA dioxygenase family protein n=1 Tax=Streptomyces sp. TRM 70351 TaxID=3116552 RepID=UPI002E7ACB21|nr:phytanoyl-CoA dioxygenase family protein [Streptomyces sp. TRM 70351]MEE1927142.1 phytanoyl-CoA dioxygenase family protein [Streptomyces sp. TRM 70351]